MKTLIEKIKSRGSYWKVLIRPANYQENLISSLDECKLIIEQSKVRLRGWDYPYIDHREGIKAAGDNSVHSFCNWEEGSRFEYWRFYQTGQFVHYFSMWEELWMDEEKKNGLKRWINGLENQKVDRFLSIISTLYSITEIFEFASRMSSKIDASSFEIIIELYGTKNMMLFFEDRFRFLHQAYICAYEPIHIERILTKEVLLSKSSQVALDITIEIFKKFNWDGVNKQIFTEDQKKLLERRL